MQIKFVYEAEHVLRAADAAFSAKVFGNTCDAIIAYTGSLPNETAPMLFLVLELFVPDPARIVALQRLLVDVVVLDLGPPFNRVGAHIEYGGQRITFVDFGRADGCINTRLGFYLPAPAASAERAGLTLSALRLPDPLDVWVPRVLHKIEAELDDLAAAACALGVAPSRMRD